MDELGARRKAKQVGIILDALRALYPDIKGAVVVVRRTNQTVALPIVTKCSTTEARAEASDILMLGAVALQQGDEASGGAVPQAVPTKDK